MSHAALQLRRTAGEALHAACRHRPGDVVFRLDGLKWLPQPGPRTLRHPNGGHVFHPFLAAARHSCEPNCRLELEQRRMVAIRAIDPGEAITFDRQATDGRILEPFDCRCGSARCRGRIG